MKRLGGVLAACGTTAALLAPAAMSAANDAEAPSNEVPGTTGPAAPVATAPAQAVNRPPLALLSARPSVATARSPVTLDASASSDPGGSIARYEWDLDGDGSYETDGGATAMIEHTFAGAGTQDVGLRVTDDGGATSEGLLSLDVAAAPKPAPATSPPRSSGSPASSSASPAWSSGESPASSGSPAPASGESPASSGSSASASASPAARSPRRDPGSAEDPPVARAAATTSVTISDFKFAPGTITVNAGDTVRWTNAGPTGHSATGSGFDTGILAKGSSGSETFSTAGTYSYICTPHPFMKGTVVVKAAGSGGSGSGSGGSGSSGSSTTGATDPFGSTGSSATSATGSGASLPTTGTNVVLVAAIGAGFLAAGLALRLAPRPRRRGG